MKLLALFVLFLFAGCHSASLRKQELLLRVVRLQSVVQHSLENENGQWSYSELAQFQTQSRLLSSIAESLSTENGSELLLPGLELTLSGIESHFSLKGVLYGSHLLHGSTTPGPSTEGVATTVTTTNRDSETTTQSSSHSTDSSIDFSDLKEVTERATALLKKAWDKIQDLTKSHKISEALSLESNVKRLEEMLDELKIYWIEINSIKTEIISSETKIQNQIQN